MTPKEKAKELVNKYLLFVDCGDNIYTMKIQIKNAKQCALITVNQIIESFKLAILDYEINSYHPARYWELVKQEIENL